MPVTTETRIQVFRRDGWTCNWCKRQLILHQYLKLRQRELRSVGQNVQIYQQQFKRSEALFCDELAAVVDHIRPVSMRGADTLENLVASCNKCNNIRSNRPVHIWNQDLRVRDQIDLPDNVFGERAARPMPHDGFSMEFVRIVKEHPTWLVTDENGKEMEAADKDAYFALLPK